MPVSYYCRCTKSRDFRVQGDTNAARLFPLRLTPTVERSSLSLQRLPHSQERLFLHKALSAFACWDVLSCEKNAQISLSVTYLCFYRGNFRYFLKLNGRRISPVWVQYFVVLMPFHALSFYSQGDVTKVKLKKIFLLFPFFCFYYNKRKSIFQYGKFNIFCILNFACVDFFCVIYTNKVEKT